MSYENERYERHNENLSRILDIIVATSSAPGANQFDAMVLLETVIVGAIAYYALPEGDEIILETLKESVQKRLANVRAEAQKGMH
jgi:hypothetical protein